jgi:xanthine dehydrogenase accessory factor
MMFVGEDQVLGSIGGGESEYLAIEHARSTTQVTTREYRLNNKRADGLDMVCGGTIQVLFVPVCG